MKNTLLNISAKIDDSLVKIYELIVEVAHNNQIKFFVIGATARDMVFEYGHDIKAPRATRDIDLAVQVATWAEFQNLKNALIATGQFSSSKMEQRLFYQNDTPLDIVPFGAIAGDDTCISWPPDGSVKMNITGFADAYQATQTVRLRENPELDIQIVTIPALVILKLMAWRDRPEQSKDATDLAFLLRNYLDAGQTERLAQQHGDLLAEYDFDFERAGARLLGRDIASFVSAATKQKLQQILSTETGEQKIYRLVEAMTHRENGQTFANNLALLNALYLGINELTH